jgi:beta-galactosidase
MACYKDVAGIELEEFDSLNDYKVKVEGAFGKGKASIWADIIKPITAKPVATYESEYYTGKPAITVNEYGKGKCFYIGCDLDEEATIALMDCLAKDCNIEPAMKNAPAGVEIVRKVAKNGDRFWFLMNFGDKEETVELSFDAKDIATGKKLGNRLNLPLYGALAITQA